jgi:transcriptional regulator with AAA-type ATPase domain
VVASEVILVADKTDGPALKELRARIATLCSGKCDVRLHASGRVKPKPDTVAILVLRTAQFYDKNSRFSPGSVKAKLLEQFAETPVIVILDKLQAEVVEWLWTDALTSLGAVVADDARLAAELRAVLDRLDARARVWEERKELVPIGREPMQLSGPHGQAGPTMVSNYQGEMGRMMAELSAVLRSLQGPNAQLRQSFPSSDGDRKRRPRARPKGAVTDQLLDLVYELRREDITEPGRAERLVRMLAELGDPPSSLESDAAGKKDKASVSSIRSLRARLEERFGAMFWSNEKLSRHLQERNEMPSDRSLTAQLSDHILIEGETGTGKTLIAHLIHKRVSPLENAPFYQVNCATLSAELLDTELFGAMRGAYTSLERTRAGAILSNYGGTVFLDEIGDLPESAQGMLLSFLDRGTLRPLSWPDEELWAPVRIIAATNRNLLIPEDGRPPFRQDLYFRFKHRLRVPPLRDRAEDIPLLVDQILGSLPDASLRPKFISRRALEKLKDYEWPGNVRELGATVLEAAARAARFRDRELLEQDIRIEVPRLRQEQVAVAVHTRYRRDARGKPTDELEYLLIWNPTWQSLFFLSEQCTKDRPSLRGGLEAKLRGRYKLGDRTSDFMLLDHGEEFRLLQFSDRELCQKFYRYHPFSLHAKSEDARKALYDIEPSDWVTAAELLSGGLSRGGWRISSTFPKLLRRYPGCLDSIRPDPGA